LGTPGTYEFRVTVSDGDKEDSDTATVSVNDVNVKPDANLRASPSSIDEGQSVRLDASGSSDPDGSDGNLDYSWMVVRSPGGASPSTPSGERGDVTLGTPGTYEFRVTVSDGDKDDSDTAVITVGDVNIGPDADLQVSSSSINEGQSVGLDASGSSDPDGPTANLRYEWAVVQSPVGSVPTPNGQRGTVTLSNPGTYEFEVTVTDENGNGKSDTAMATVTVRSGNNSTRLDQSLICTDVDSPVCPADATTTTVRQDDDRAISWLRFRDLRKPINITWQFYTPSGDLYSTVETVGNEDGRYWETYRHWAWIEVAGTDAATMPGEWTVEVSVDGSLATTQEFTITNDTEGTGPVDGTQFQEASLSGVVTDRNDDPIPDAAVWAQQFTWGPSGSKRVTIQPNTNAAPGTAAYAEAVDDDSDSFVVRLQEFNVATGQYVTVDTDTATAAELLDYEFEEFADVSVVSNASQGFQLYDRTVNGEGTYTLEPVPAEDSQVDTQYSVQAVKYDAPFAGRQGNPGQAAVRPFTTDDADVVVPVDVTSSSDDLRVSELKAPQTATVTGQFEVEATIENVGTGAATDREVQYRFDIDDDNLIEPSEVVATQRVDVPAGGTVSVSFDVDAGSLGVSPAEFVHGVAVPSSQESVTSTLSLQPGPRDTPSVVVEDVTASPDGTTSAEIRVGSAPKNVLRYSVTVELGDTSVGRFTGLNTPLPVQTRNATQSNYTFRGVQFDGSISPGDRLGTLDIATDTTGTTSLDVTVHSLSYLEDGESHEYTDTIGRDGTLRVAETAFPDGIPGGTSDTPPTDTDGDGLVEDLDGDGQFTFVDVVELVFAIDTLAETDLSQAQTAALDHSNDGTVGFTDVIDLVFQL
jgi:hypothetical protein